MTSAKSKPAASYDNITHCRICGGTALTDCMAFGEQHLATHFVPTNEGHPLANLKVPLTVALCGDCGLVQLKETVDRKVLFSSYFYRSGTNPMMRDALQDVVDDVTARASLKSGDTIVDVGCNDGTMLTYFPDIYRRIGVEPATNINWSGLPPSIHIINDFFSKAKLDEVTGGAPCRLITSIAMLYSVEDLNAFAAEAKSMLAKDGVWCIQLSYLPTILKTMSFYDVCHEHLYYFSLATLEHLLERNGLSIYDASLNDVNGGSLRVFVTHQENARQKAEGYHRILEEEKKLSLTDVESYRKFFNQVRQLKVQITDYLHQEADRGNLVVGLGASTKGNVLLQFFDIDNKLLPYISERNPEKVSLRTLGTDIELVSEETAREMGPSCMLVLIWFFKDEIIKREKGYLENGGKLLFPMPYFHVVSKDGEEAV